MVRRNIYLTEEHFNYLKKVSQCGISASEVLRRIIDKHLLSLEPAVSASESKKGGQSG